MNAELHPPRMTRLETLREALGQGAGRKVHRLVNSMHPAEIASLLESLPPAQRDLVWDLVDPELEGDVLVELNEEVRADLIEDMEAEDLVAAAENLELDDLADLLEDLPEHVHQQVLRSMDSRDRERLHAVMAYEPDSAGGLMNPDTVSVRPDVTLETVLRYLRMRGDVPENTDSLFVVNRHDRYLGTLDLARLLTEDPERTVGEVMDAEVPGITPDTPASKVASLFEDRDLLSAAVVDAAGRLLGRITVDDVVDVIRDEAEHSVMSMAGLDEETDMFAGVTQSARRRGVWLGINLGTAFLAAWVVGLFESTIANIVALAILMPIVASMGGVAATQTLTLMVRGLALGQVERGNARWLLNREFAVAMLNGLAWATVVAVVADLCRDGGQSRGGGARGRAGAAGPAPLRRRSRGGRRRGRDHGHRRGRVRFPARPRYAVPDVTAGGRGGPSGTARLDEEGLDLLAPCLRIGVAEGHQFPGVRRFEQQVARQQAAARLQCADRAQQHPQAARHLVHVAAGDGSRVVTGLDHQHLDRPAARVPTHPIGRQQVVDLAQALQVDRQAVREQRVEHETEQVPRAGPDVRRAVRGARRRLGARADHQHPVGAQVHRRAQRCELPHRTVAVVLPIHACGRKHEGDRRARHQHVEVDGTAHAGTTCALPLARSRSRVKECDGLAGGVAGRGDRQGLDRPGREALRDALQRDRPGEQFPQGARVEQRTRRRQQPAARQHRQEPVQARPQHRARIRAHHLVEVEIRPHALQHRHARRKAVAAGSQCRRIERARGGSHQDVERARRVVRQPLADRPQHADLVGGTRATAGENQTGPAFEEEIVGACIRRCQGAPLADSPRCAD